MTVDALVAESQALRDALAGLPERDFSRATGCEPWTVKELLAHLLVACQRVPGMLDGPVPARAEVSARQYFTGDKLGGAFDRERVERAQRDAAGFASGHELVEGVVVAVDETAERVRAEPADRLVFTRWGEPMLLAEYLKTRVFELTVHGLDVALALGRTPWTTEPAAAVTAAVLLEGVDAEPPWDEVTFIAKATGRAPLSQEEAATARETLLWPRVSPP